MVVNRVISRVGWVGLRGNTEVLFTISVKKCYYRMERIRVNWIFIVQTEKYKMKVGSVLLDQSN